jgi:hypothetical protein
MSVREFSSGPVKDKILTVEECKIITKYQKTSKIDPFYKLCRNNIERMQYDHIYVTASSIDDIPTTLEEYKAYKFDSLAYVEYCSKQTQYGIQVPTQIETVISNSTQYKEQMSIIVYSQSEEKILESTAINVMANYDSLINIAYSKELNIKDFWEIFHIYVIFHQSGFYPRKVCREWCTPNAIGKPMQKKGEFGDFSASFVWEPDFKFIAHVIEELDDKTVEEEIVV